MSTNTKAISDDILRAAHKLGCDIRHHIAHSEIELIQHDVAVDLMIAKAIHDAVMAERERCARLADLPGHSTVNVAAAIRAGA